MSLLVEIQKALIQAQSHFGDSFQKARYVVMLPEWRRQEFMDEIDHQYLLFRKTDTTTQDIVFSDAVIKFDDNLKIIEITVTHAP